MSDEARTNFWWPVLILVVLTACGLALYRGVSNYSLVERELGQVRATNQQLDARNKALYREVLRLRGDPRATEKAARQEMGLAEPGEIIYQQAAGKNDKSRSGK